MGLANEEEVKIKIVLPYLKSLGFQKEELNFEKSFSLNLGRYAYKINTEEQYQNASARLDILVKRNDKNLFIIEVKRGSKKINANDAEQAISYARLVHPIAPFAIVTNGNTFSIYNSVTKEKVRKSKFIIKDMYEIDFPENLLYDALKHFFGYSKNNLLYFCQEQVKEGMTTLLGSKKDATKIFIPRIYTPRKKFDGAFKLFLRNEVASAFPLIGDSGSGKTSSMCYKALELLENGSPVLFYRANKLINGIFKSISDDFNWVFTPEYSEIQVFKRIEELFEPDKLIIFIDAIDEWDLKDRVEIIDNFVSKIRNKKIKLVLSCKTNAWSGFLAQKDTPLNCLNSFLLALRRSMEIIWMN